MSNIKFETIGNATIICYDKTPILVTDPWFKGAPYFGSWGLSHEIPAEQLEAIKSCEYVWISHGHQDHLMPDSIGALKKKKILLPDHRGSRIKNDIAEHGFDVYVLKDKEWVQLSENIRIMCLSDYNQDAILLIDINGRLIINMNDAPGLGWNHFVRETVKRYPVSFHLKLYAGYADMCNFYDEDGTHLRPLSKEASPFSWGQTICRDTEHLGAKYFIPFSSFHQMTRTDSAWLSDYLIAPSDYVDGFTSDRCKLLPAFVQYDCCKDIWLALEPKKIASNLKEPKECGDDWNEQLEKSDVEAANQYFKSIEHLHGFLDFINLKVGGQDNIIEFNKKGFDRGLTFEAPRTSLMASINYQVFDDILIGNFMKTTLHGKWSETPLYPDFSPYVAKYADNGKAKSEDELSAYFKDYKKRIGIKGVVDIFQQKIEKNSKNTFRSWVAEDSAVYQLTKKIYHSIR